MPTVVSFQKRLPPAAAGSASRGTLAELMAKSKAAADAQSAAMQQPSPTIMQGIGNVASQLASAWSGKRAENQLHEGQAALSQIMGAVGPEGATPEQIAAAGQYDPEVMKSLLADRVQRQRTLADFEHWSPVTPEQRQQLGIGPDVPMQYNEKTGEFKNLTTGGNTTISTGDKVQGEFEKNIGKMYTDVFKGDIQSGQEAQVTAANVDHLASLMPDAYTGTEALISNYLVDNYGISLGDKTDATSAFSALIDSMIPKQRVEGSGTSSNLDVQMFKRALPTLLKSKNANTLIMGYVKALAQRNMSVSQIAQQAALMPQADAIKFYQDSVNKLGSPLAGLDKIVADIKKQDPNAAAAAPADPANPEAPADPAAPDAAPAKPGEPTAGPGGSTVTIEPDGTKVYKYPNGSVVRERRAP